MCDFKRHDVGSRRKTLRVLVEHNKPVGGKWIFDKWNRRTFERAADVPRPHRSHAGQTPQEFIEQMSYGSTVQKSPLFDGTDSG